MNEQIKALESLKDSLQEKESPELKALKKVWETTKDEAFKEVIERKILESRAPDVDLNGAIDKLDRLGYAPEYVLSKGIAKIVGELKWKEKKEAETK